MSRPVFIHPRSTFLERIKKESNGKALTTTSMLDALKWITQPENHLSGVFIYPDDTTFSALHFIELALNHRPALPVYLLEQKLAQNKPGSDRITQLTNIRGVLLGIEPYEKMIEPLKEVLPLKENKPRTVPSNQTFSGYITVPVTDFYHGTQYPFNVFIPSEDGTVRLFAPKDSPIDKDYLAELAKKSSWILVREDEVAQARAKIQSTRSNIATNSDVPVKWRSAEIMVSGKSLLEELKKAGVADTMVQHTQNMLNDLYSLLSHLDSDDEGNLFDIIDRAKKCDRAVFCASYSILLCKQMRYEKTATLEILGFASIMQDVSLYQTPYGDLSEKKPSSMSEEELQFYLKHPVLSSDMVAQHTDLPQVTLQVIRQAHERRDKTGFPNKVGGSLLHAMAEMLSLINTYYEVLKENYSQSEMVEHLQRNVFPHYAENVVHSFKQVLGNVLKEKVFSEHAEQHSIKS